MRYNQRFPHLCLCVLTRTGASTYLQLPLFLQTRSTVWWCCEECTSTGCRTQRWARRSTSCPQWATTCSDAVSHPVLGDKSESRVLSSTEVKWTHFSIMPGSLTKAWGSEWSMKSPLPPQQTDGQRHSHLFPALCLLSTLAFPSGSWRLWPKVSLANTLCFPQLTLPRNDIYSSRWGLSSCPNCVLSCANSMTLENTNSEK